MSRQCYARIQIATSRSLELDPEFAASMFYCVRDPLHEGPHWITMPSKSESPAPPPCKAESLSWEGQARLYKALHANCDLTIAAKDAEIAELRAERRLLAGQLALADSAWGPKEWIKWAEKHAAALAPKEGT